jgi:hypothetical protein
MKIIKDYLRLIIFTIGLLVGVQLPAVVDQYAKRVDAKLVESNQNLVGFQLTADRYFAGDIKKLVAHYLASEDAVFKQDAANIQFIVQRVTLLQEEFEYLQQGALTRTFHVVFKHDNSIMRETLAQYTYVLILQPSALLWGVTIALFLSLLIDACLASLIGTVRMISKPRARI